MKQIHIIFTALLLALTLLCTPNPIQVRAESVLDVYNAQAAPKQNGERFTAQSTIWTMGALSALAEGNEFTKGQGAIPSSTKMVASMLTNPPVHTATYVADLIHNFHVPGITPAYAQGIGFSGLTPILQIWKAFRNLSYFLFIIIFIVIGFMIMLRKKISQQAVVTIQEALPQIIFTLIIITFSYAIAGFVIDLIYLVIFIVTGLFQQFQILSSADVTRSVIFSHNVIGIGIQFLAGPGNVAGEASQAVSHLLTSMVRLDKLAPVANVFAYVIIAIAIVIAMFRTLYGLITAYINIILAVIFAPITLLMNAFPGSDAFAKWLKGLVANAAVFPAVTIVLIIGAALVGSDNGEDFGLPANSNTFGWQEGGAGWVPPLVGGGSEGGGVDIIRSVIGLGMIMILPEVSKKVKEAMEVKESNLGASAVGGLGSGFGVFTGVQHYRQQRLQEYYYKRSLPGKQDEKAKLWEKVVSLGAIH